MNWLHYKQKLWAVAHVTLSPFLIPLKRKAFLCPGSCSRLRVLGSFYLASSIQEQQPIVPLQPTYLFQSRSLSPMIPISTKSLNHREMKEPTGAWFIVSFNPRKGFSHWESSENTTKSLGRSFWDGEARMPVPSSVHTLVSFLLFLIILFIGLGKTE